MIVALLLSINSCTPSPVYRSGPRTEKKAPLKPQKFQGAETSTHRVLKAPLSNYSRAAVISFFGLRKHPAYHTSEFHPGIDIKAVMGDPVTASAGGSIIYSGKQSGYGNIVIIDHDEGLCTVYAHLSEILAETGSVVTEGQVIGRVGMSGNSTGPHLHFEVRVGGKAVDPIGYLSEK
jgi:murein DD-endopeptidase MepM/ murein hydrolase activator NlpD